MQWKLPFFFREKKKKKTRKSTQKYPCKCRLLSGTLPLVLVVQHHLLGPSHQGPHVIPAGQCWGEQRKQVRMFPGALWPCRGLCWRNQLLRWWGKSTSPPNEVTVTVTASVLGFLHPMEPQRSHSITDTVGCWTNHRLGINGHLGSPIFLHPMTRSDMVPSTL